MKFSIAAIALLATSVVALPSGTERLSRRVERRQTSRRTNPLQRIEQQSHIDDAPTTTHPEYSSNWSGVVIESPPAGATFTAVSATFTVPKPTSTGGGGSQAASAWVGIDGDTCGSAILQTGVDFTVSGSSVSFDAWYEWYPDYAYDFSGISFSPGDTVVLSVTSTSNKAGSAHIQNVSKGQTVSKSITSSSALCGQNAEWIVEDFEEGGGLVPFANFNTVTFTNAIAKTSSGSTVSSSTGTQIDIQQNGKTLTSVSQSGSSVTVKYV